MKNLLLCSLLLGLTISATVAQYGIPDTEDDDDLYPPSSMAEFLPAPQSTAGISYTKYEDEAPVVLRDMSSVYDIRRSSPMPAYTSAAALPVVAPVATFEVPQEPIRFAIRTENPVTTYAEAPVYNEPSTSIRFEDTAYTFNNDQSVTGYNIRSEAAVPIVRYIMDSNNHGDYHLETITGNGITKTVTGQLKDLGGSEGPVVVNSGSYSYTGDDGKLYAVQWKADENGFQAFGDHLPKVR